MGINIENEKSLIKNLETAIAAYSQGINIFPGADYSREFTPAAENRIQQCCRRCSQYMKIARNSDDKMFKPVYDYYIEKGDKTNCRLGKNKWCHKKIEFARYRILDLKMQILGKISDYFYEEVQKLTDRRNSVSGEFLELYRTGIDTANKALDEFLPDDCREPLLENKAADHFGEYSVYKERTLYANSKTVLKILNEITNIKSRSEPGNIVNRPKFRRTVAASISYVFSYLHENFDIISAEYSKIMQRQKEHEPKPADKKQLSKETVKEWWAAAYFH